MRPRPAKKLPDQALPRVFWGIFTGVLPRVSPQFIVAKGISEVFQEFEARFNKGCGDGKLPVENGAWQ